MGLWRIKATRPGRLAWPRRSIVLVGNMLIPISSRGRGLPQVCMRAESMCGDTKKRRKQLVTGSFLLAVLLPESHFSHITDTSLGNTSTHRAAFCLGCFMNHYSVEFHGKPHITIHHRSISCCKTTYYTLIMILKLPPFSKHLNQALFFQNL